jgi:putative DNA primase/helicase
MIGEATDAAAQALNRWISARGGTGSHEDRQAIQQVRHCIELQGDARFEARPGGVAVQASSNLQRPVHNRLGWREGNGKGRLWYVLPEVWKNEVCKGLDPIAAARTLAKGGMLLPSKSGRNLSRQIRVRFKVMRSTLWIRRIDGGSADGDDETQQRGVFGISREAP